MITCLADQLRRDEGLRKFPYKDSVGIETLGYGRNIQQVGISEQEADFLLENDIKAATVSLESHWPWTCALDQIRKDAMLNLVFNMGVGSLAQFKDFLAKMQAGDYAGASQAMLQSKWAEQVGPRAQRLSIQVESGAYQ